MCLQVFLPERLNGYYGVSQFVVANTIAATPFVFLIAVLSSVTVYWLASLNASGESVIYFILDLFLSLLAVSGPKGSWPEIQRCLLSATSASVAL